MPVPPKGKSQLQTPDPFHVPGYLGYCPGEKYSIGKTFGRSTNKLLTDRSTASSSKLVLSHLYPEQASEWQEIETFRKKLVANRVQSWGDQKLKDPMIPGYRGFVPKSEHYYGKRYRENMHNSISDFERDQLKRREQLRTIRRPPAISSAPGDSTKCSGPLEPVKSDMDPYVSPNQFKSLPSVYSMSCDDPNKVRKSGYTGFVPRSRGLLGSGYPAISNEALNDFNSDMWRQKSIQSAPVKTEAKKAKVHSSVPIYPVTSGMVPKYMGHVKGEKFRFGKTFGISTQNSLNIGTRTSLMSN